MQQLINGKTYDAQITVAVTEDFEKKFNKDFFEANLKKIPESKAIAALSLKHSNSLEENAAFELIQKLSVGVLFKFVNKLFKECSEEQKDSDPNSGEQG